MRHYKRYREARAVLRTMFTHGPIGLNRKAIVELLATDPSPVMQVRIYTAIIRQIGYMAERFTTKAEKEVTE